jgi:hypothetical protein
MALYSGAGQFISHFRIWSRQSYRVTSSTGILHARPHCTGTTASETTHCSSALKPPRQITRAYSRVGARNTSAIVDSRMAGPSFFMPLPGSQDLGTRREEDPAGLHCTGCCSQNQEADVRRYLEVCPWNRDIFLVDSEYTAPTDHQIRNLAGLRTCHDVVNTTQCFILWVANLGADEQRAAWADSETTHDID